MTRRLPGLAAGLAVALLAAVAAPPPAAAQAKEVRIYNWSDYVDPGVLERFTAETGIAVVYDTYDGNEILETKLLAGSTGYDLVVPSSNFLARQLGAGVYAELDRSKIPNWGNLDAGMMARAASYDPNNAHSFIYLWGTTGIAYDVAKIRERMPDAPLDSWRMMLDPAVVAKFADCGVYMLDTPDETVPAALHYLGLDPNSTAAADLERAGEQLRKVRPSIRKFHSSENINALASGDICLAHIFSGDAGIAAARAEEAGNGVEIAYVIPAEGARQWFDVMAIPKDAPNAAHAYAFIDFVLRPENMAAITNFVTYPNAVPASLPMVEEALREDPNVYPPPEVTARLYTVRPYDQRAQRAVTRLWQSVTTGG